VIYTISHYGFAVMMRGKHDPGPPPTPAGVRFVAFGLASFGVTFGLWALILAHTEEVYSGFSKRRITKRHDPKQFLAMQAGIGVLALAIVIWGVYKFVRATP
jgi:hypothetical protein